MSFCFLPIGADYKNKRRNERGMRDPHCKPERAQRVTVEFTQPEISLKGKKKEVLLFLLWWKNIFFRVYLLDCHLRIRLLTEVIKELLPKEWEESMLLCRIVTHHITLTLGAWIYPLDTLQAYWDTLGELHHVQTGDKRCLIPLQIM